MVPFDTAEKSPECNLQPTKSHLHLISLSTKAHLSHYAFYQTPSIQPIFTTSHPPATSNKHFQMQGDVSEWGSVHCRYYS